MIMSNCWGKWSFDFVRIKNIIEKAPFVNPKKLNKLWKDIDTRWCLKHDKAFLKGWNLLSFLKANHEFWIDVLSCIYWTTTFTRVNVYVILVVSTTLFWWKFFNWK